MLEGDLNTRVFQTKLTPNLGAMIPLILDKLDYAMNVELPTANGAQTQA